MTESELTERNKKMEELKAMETVEEVDRAIL